MAALGISLEKATEIRKWTYKQVPSSFSQRILSIKETSSEGERITDLLIGLIISHWGENFNQIDLNSKRHHVRTLIRWFLHNLRSSEYHRVARIKRKASANRCNTDTAAIVHVADPVPRVSTPDALAALLEPIVNLINTPVDANPGLLEPISDPVNTPAANPALSCALSNPVAAPVDALAAFLEPLSTPVVTPVAADPLLSYTPSTPVVAPLDFDPSLSYTRSAPPATPDDANLALSYIPSTPVVAPVHANRALSDPFSTSVATPVATDAALSYTLSNPVAATDPALPYTFGAAVTTPVDACHALPYNLDTQVATPIEVIDYPAPIPIRPIPPIDSAFWEPGNMDLEFPVGNTVESTRPFIPGIIDLVTPDLTPASSSFIQTPHNTYLDPAIAFSPGSLAADIDEAAEQYRLSLEPPPSPTLSVASSVTLCGKSWTRHHTLPPPASPTIESHTDPLKVVTTRLSTGQSDSMNLWSFEGEANDLSDLRAYYEAILNFNPTTECLGYVASKHITEVIDSTEALTDLLDKCSKKGETVELQIF